MFGETYLLHFICLQALSGEEGQPVTLTCPTCRTPVLVPAEGVKSLHASTKEIKIICSNSTQ
jgi:hypothetical protein